MSKSNLSKLLFLWIALAPLAFAGRNNLNEFRVINKRKLRRTVAELAQEKEVDGLIYDIKIGKIKEGMEFSQSPTIYFAPSFNKTLDESAKKAFSAKYREGPIDSAAVKSELRKLENLATECSVIYKIIITDKKFPTSTHDTVYVNYFKSSFIRRRDGKLLESKPSYKEVFPIKK